MAISRREFTKQIAALGGLAASGFSGFASAAEKQARLIPWRNWSGGQMCLPQARLAPATEAELADLLKAAVGTVRAVGAGHSFSALVPTEGSIVSLSKFSGLLAHDAEKLQAEFGAGTRMADMGAPLKAIGQALPNMADIDYQTLAGAISTSTHGTGPRFGSYSSTVVGLRMVTAGGEVLDLDAEHQPQLFKAACCSLGSLGIITRVRLQNRKAFRLRRKEWIGNTEELLEQWPQLVKQHDHFEIQPLLHADVSVATALNDTTETITLAKAGGGDGDAVGKLEWVNRNLRNSPRAQDALLSFIARHAVDFPEVVDDSWKVFANVRDMRFNEMEYEVPAEAGPACLREVLKLIKDQNLSSYIPTEFRYVRGDDLPMSMFSGGDRCAISVHQSIELDYHNFFAQVEPIFWKYEGRPHWGKLHTLNVHQLSKLYPQFKDFTAIRSAMDPGGKFLNGHLRALFGVN